MKQLGICAITNEHVHKWSLHFLVSIAADNLELRLLRQQIHRMHLGYLFCQEDDLQSATKRIQ